MNQVAKDSNQMSVTIDALANATTYDVQVRALIDDSTCPWSAAAQGTTP